MERPDWSDPDRQVDYLDWDDFLSEIAQLGGELSIDPTDPLEEVDVEDSIAKAIERLTDRRY
jgi:hypothetical protein